jgi:hypothetical protein
MICISTHLFSQNLETMALATDADRELLLSLM